MKERQSDRRQVLKVIIGGVAAVLLLPGQWTKPVISTVVGPAHARSSPAATTNTTNTTNTTRTTNTTNTTTTTQPPKTTPPPKTTEDPPTTPKGPV